MTRDEFAEFVSYDPHCQCVSRLPKRAAYLIGRIATPCVSGASC